MQAQRSQMKQGVSGSESNMFEEEMRSAFWRGVALLNESQPDAGQPQGETAVESGPSSHAEGFSEIPKDVMALKPVIGLLMKTDPCEGVSKEWISLAKTHAQWLKDNAARIRKGMEELLSNLEDEMTLVDFFIKETRR